MKNILSEITQEEKNRILEMHKTATSKYYLSEQVVGPETQSLINTTIKDQEIQDLLKKAKELENELMALDQATGGVKGRFKEKTQEEIEKFKTLMNKTKDNISQILIDIKDKISSIKINLEQKKQDKETEKTIRNLEKYNKELERNIEQLKNEKIMTTSQIKEFFNKALGWTFVGILGLGAILGSVVNPIIMSIENKKERESRASRDF